MSELGGDPACWLADVCPNCDAVLTDGEPHDCQIGPDPDDEGRAPICPTCGVTALPAELSHVIDTRFVCENPDCEAYGETF